MPYRNPVIPGFYPDPSICRVGTDYYLTTSTFSWFPGCPIFHSRDLVHWKQIGHILERESQLKLREPDTPIWDGIHAPTLRYHNGRFYCITTNRIQGGNFIVSAERPEGPWSDPIWTDPKGWDPSLLFDEDGKVYCQWTVSRDGSHGIHQYEIDPDTGEKKSDVRNIFTGTSSGGTEGPHLYHIGDYYYLLVAEGGTHWGHQVVFARSRSPWGPFEACPHGPALTHRDFRFHQQIQATGHADLIQAHDGSWWLVCLGHRTFGWCVYASHHLGRETFLAPVDWTEDGWPRVHDGEQLQLAMETPTLPLQPEPQAEPRTHFNGSQLPLEWNFLRNPVAASWRLTDQVLELKGLPETLREPGCAMVGRRQQHAYVTATTSIEFAPASDNEEAGLAVFMDERHHSALSLVSSEGKRFVRFQRTIGVLSVEVGRVEIPEGPIDLIIEATPRWYAFGFCIDHQVRWVGAAETKYHSTEIAWGWTGIYFCLFATGNGLPAATPARFRWFDYRPATDQTFTTDMNTAEASLPDKQFLLPQPQDQ